MSRAYVVAFMKLPYQHLGAFFNILNSFST